MTRRSRAREVALQLLFQRDFNPELDTSVVEQFAHARLNDPVSEPFCLSLYHGVISHLTEIDDRIAKSAENWRISRMAGVDRGVLRIGAYELMFTPDTPASVVIDEAIELSRRFGSADSPAFVNGVLDSLRKDPEAPAEPPSAP
jgi:N utilization substance protein B